MTLAFTKTLIGSVEADTGNDCYYLVKFDPDQPPPFGQHHVEEAFLPEVYQFCRGPGTLYVHTCHAIAKPHSDGYEWIVMVPMRRDV